MKDVNKKFVAGYITYKENEILNAKIQKISQEKDLRKKKNLLLDLQKEEFHSELSQHHIQYYIDDCIVRQKEKIKRFIWGLGTVFIIIGTILFTLYIYQRLYNIGIDNKTYTQAVEYYKKEDYDASEKRILALVKAGWDGYGIFHYESLIAEKKKDYEAACNSILYFLDHYYGFQNVTEDNTAYKRLEQLNEQYIDDDKNSGISDETVEKLQNAIKILGEYSNQEYNIANYIYHHKWKRAISYCENLIREGACNYNLCVQYVFSLIEVNEYQKAEQYLKTYLSSMSDYEKHTITGEQINALIEYVGYTSPDLTKKEAEKKVERYIKEYAGGSSMSTWEGTPYEVYLSSNTFEAEVIPYMKDFLEKINYWNVLDNIEVAEYDIVEGTDGYGITLTKNETQKKYKFFLSRNGRFVYIFMDGKWTNLTENDFSSGFDLECGNTFVNFYNEDPIENSLTFVNDKNKDILMKIQFSEEQNNYFFRVMFKKNKELIGSSEVRLDDNQFSFPVYLGAASEDFKARVILGNRLIILIESVFENKYNMLEGLYVLK